MAGTNPAIFVALRGAGLESAPAAWVAPALVAPLFTAAVAGLPALAAGFACLLGVELVRRALLKIGRASCRERE